MLKITIQVKENKNAELKVYKNNEEILIPRVDNGFEGYVFLNSIKQP